ncbi:MAG: hypothetical protein H0T42_26040 [Deltaproteobacteria bacterium]|nr:hypothetical protein [Deltaproteobacteria bacterium]
MRRSDEPKAEIAPAAAPAIAIVTPADKVERATGDEPKASTLSGSGSSAAATADTGTDPGARGSAATGSAGPGSGAAGSAGSSSNAHGVTAAPVKPTARVTAKPTKPPNTKPVAVATDDDPTARGQLDRADAALGSGKTDEAWRLAQTVINSDAAPGQRARAYAIKGVIACRKNQDREAASIALRQVPPSAPRQRLRIVKACHDVGIELDQR